MTVINPLSEMAPLAIPVYSKVAGSFGGIVFSRRSFVGMRSAVIWELVPPVNLRLKIETSGMSPVSCKYGDKIYIKAEDSRPGILAHACTHVKTRLYICS